MVAILDPLAALSVRMTVDEYLDAELPEGYRYELVDGEIQVTPPPGGEHDDVIDRLNILLTGHRQQHPERIQHISFRGGVPVPGKTTLREPDIAVYRQWEAKGRGKSVWKEFTPTLAIEVVSIGGESRDYTEKREEYWSAGIEEYWIVDPHSVHMTVLTRSDRQWQERVCQPSDSFISQCLPDLHINVAQVLGLTS